MERAGTAFKSGPETIGIASSSTIRETFFNKHLGPVYGFLVILQSRSE